MNAPHFQVWKLRIAVTIILSTTPTLSHYHSVWRPASLPPLLRKTATQPRHQSVVVCEKQHIHCICIITWKLWNFTRKLQILMLPVLLIPLLLWLCYLKVQPHSTAVCKYYCRVPWSNYYYHFYCYLICRQHTPNCSQYQIMLCSLIKNSITSSIYDDLSVLSIAISEPFHMSRSIYLS